MLHLYCFQIIILNLVDYSLDYYLGKKANV